MKARADVCGFAGGDVDLSGLFELTAGVANFGADQMRRIADQLARAGVPLAANQVNYSLAHRAEDRPRVFGFQIGFVPIAAPEPASEEDEPTVGPRMG
jgi:hypothetical protein